MRGTRRGARRRDAGAALAGAAPDRAGRVARRASGRAVAAVQPQRVPDRAADPSGLHGLRRVVARGAVRRSTPARARVIAFVACFALALAISAAVLAARWWLRGSAVMETAQSIAADAVERRYNLLEAVREGIYILDDDLRLTHVNDEAERLLQRTADELIGVELIDVLDPLASELVPDIRAARRSGVPIERVHAFPARQTWVEVRILPAAGETVVSMQDVSAQTLAESQLHENAHSLQLVENNVDAILWTVGRDGRFTAISGGALEELGLTGDDLRGQPCAALIAEDVVRDVFTGRQVRVENAHGDHWLRHHVEPLADRDGKIIGAVGVSIDITELKRTQRQLFDA
ncbi:MAG: PAS domain-containing protein, partial [Candidatus Eremiobacteraeota bacterium]|nr:PAS domain-containing protein [Candidatus Eremiobacteraeota bacterium]